MTRGRFITVEGIEGAGKSTLIPALRTALERTGRQVVVTREPGGTPLAERLREVVLGRGDESIAPLAETLLMFAARRIHLDNFVRPALAAGRWVLCDRFTDATRAYQGGGRGVDVALIERLASDVHDGLEPDLTLLLDVPADVGLARVRGRRGEADRIEGESLRFFERVRAAYLDRARAEPARFRLIDAAAPLVEVERAAIAALEDLR